MSDDVTAKLIVMDTGPLITLAAADNLDYLTYPKLPIYVPDAVFYEATRDADMLGAQQVMDWAQKRPGQVNVIPTEAFANFLQESGGRRGRYREKDLGERAALEAIHDAVQLRSNERAILITEDDRVLRQALVFQPELTDRMIPITTRDFLEGLEQAQRIQSVEAVYRRAEDAGRHASQRQALAQQHEKAVTAVQSVLQG
ncbi:hypothetical protein CNY89_17965, partial [Amaricoccus sp. HAR-UPW-R2A-40]